ncbi:MAG TPA: hypothetical protein PLV92_29535, partial [Pirellulaceae bacterium]|nr:hypothetical protein [Pirellulaceae bacterium]
IVDGTGAVVAASVESLKEALGGAVYDEFTRFNAAQAATLQAAMAPFKLDEVFESGARGPLFAFQGGLQVGANGISLNLNLQVNIDVELARRFEMSATDLPAVAQELVPSFALSGLASSRLVTALNVDMGVDLAKGAGPDFSIDSESWLRLNRFDAGVRVAVTDLEASLNVAGLADVQVKKGTIDLRAAAQVALTDPDNSDGLERLTSTERGSSPWSDFVELTTTSNLRGQMTLNASGAGFDLNDFGVPTLIFRAPDLIQHDVQTDTWSIAQAKVFLDVRIGEALKAKILDVLETIDDAGNGALSSDTLHRQIPGLDRSVGDLLGLEPDSSGRVQLFKLRPAAAEYLNSFS